MLKPDTLLLSDSARVQRAALLSGSQLVELFYQTEDAVELKGNIYLGKVLRIIPGMQAAFVDIGESKNGLLSARDVSGDRPTPDIQSLLHEGQLIAVQVTHDSKGDKGPKLSTQISVSNRSFAFIYGGEQVRYSHRINDARIKQRIEACIASLDPENSRVGGLVVRTAAAELSELQLCTDYAHISKLGHSIKRAFEANRTPTRIYQTPAFAPQVMSEQLQKFSSIKSVIVDTQDHFERLTSLLEDQFSGGALCVTLHQAEQPLFEAFGVESQIAELLSPRVDLPNGGQLVIESTEALTAIDVNSRGFVGDRQSKDLALVLNQEALSELQSQLCLRNLNGLIVIDFVDMSSKESILALERSLQQWSSIDAHVTSVSGVSKNGLVELTRRRSRPSLNELMLEPCGNCLGQGKIQSKALLTIEIIFELQRQHLAAAKKTYTLMANPSLIGYLEASRGEEFDKLAQRLQVEIKLSPEQHYQSHDYDIVAA